MTRSDDFNKWLERQQFSNYDSLTGAFRESQNIGRFLRDARTLDSAIRAAYGPLYDIRRSELYSLSRTMSEVMQPWMRVTESLQDFRMPTFAEYASPLSGYLEAYEAASRYPTLHIADEVQKSIQTITTPWLNAVNEMQPVQGLVGLYGIGSALRDLSAYSLDLTDGLRLDLGDWREVTLPQNIEDDPIERASFYETLGFNPGLTAFPNDAFEQLITESGVRTPDVPMLEDYYPVPTSEEIEEQGFERTNRAHDLIIRFETHLREFISELMEGEIGQNWVKQRISSNMRTQWEEKQRRDLNQRNQALPLIAYADFTDYVVIICRNDNWIDLFESTFERKQSVQESFYRLFPIRLATMHARIITQDDELYLHVETRRILKAIGIAD